MRFYDVYTIGQTKVYDCGFCAFITRSEVAIKEHLKTFHKKGQNVLELMEAKEHEKRDMEKAEGQVPEPKEI